MATLRLIQNFRGFRAHLMVADRRPVEMLETALERLGLAVCSAAFGDGAPLDLKSLRSDHDILFIDGDLEPPLHLADTPLGIPVIGLVGVEAPSRLKALMGLGATAFLRKPVHGSTVYSALFMGVNEFRSRRNLEIRIEEQERRRRGRRFVIKAIVALSRQAGLDDDQAFDILRRESMRARLSLEQYCEQYLALSVQAEKQEDLDKQDTCRDPDMIRGGNK